MSFDVFRGHLGERRRSPVWTIVLVDDHGPDALIEIMSICDAGHYAEFRLHALRKRPVAAMPHLRKCDLEAERRLGTDRRRDLACPARIVTCRRGLRVD